MDSDTPLIRGFDLRASFTCQPPGLQKCPRCQDRVSATSLDATEAGESFRRYGLIPVVITNLLRCKRCQWWAIREYREDCEAHDFVEEEIVMISPDLPIASNTALPTWESVLKDFSRYRKNLQVTDSAFAKRLEW